MSFVAAAAGAAAARGRNRVAADLRAAAALSAAAAISYQPVDHLARRMLPRMIRDGVVHETAPGVMWLDEAAFAAHAARMRRNAMIAVLVMTTIVVTAAVVMFYIAGIFR